MTTLADEIPARLHQEVARTENMMEQIWEQYQNLDYLEGRIRAQRDLAEAILETGELQNGSMGRHRIDDLEQVIVILYRQLCTVKEAQAERERKREQARRLKQQELEQARDAQILKARAPNGTEEA